MIETQETVHRWIHETFPGLDPDSPRNATRALEEMVELCLASGASPREIQTATLIALKGHPADERRFLPDKIPAEAADVLIILYAVAGMRNFNLNACVDLKMEINRTRKWKTNGDGTGYHIREETSNL